MLKKTYTPVGARLIVSEIVTSLSLEERAKRSGLIAIVENDNRPQATMGTVEAVGSDPMFKEEDIRIGDIVHFGPHAGYETFLEGHQFRMLEWQDITLVEKDRTTEPPEAEPLTTHTHHSEHEPELS